MDYPNVCEVLRTLPNGSVEARMDVTFIAGSEKIVRVLNDQTIAAIGVSNLIAPLDLSLVRLVHRQFMRQAADLLSDDGENDEYDRAVLEVTMRTCGFNEDSRRSVEMTLRGMKDGTITV